MTEFTIANIMEWDENDTRKLKSLVYKLSKCDENGDTFGITFDDVRNEVSYGYDITDIEGWFLTIGRLVLETMCEYTKDYIDANADEIENYEEIYDKLTEIEDSAFSYISFDYGKLIDETPFKMFKVNNFYSTFDDKVDKLIKQLEKFEI
jgi:hypothetical protein